ncbi:MAG TPA: AsmA-like C-terminal region-containing protein [Terriglobales bacterium]|nr:AsmA-like C-terminal region-containing protein [Terriglobales bacterium]
MGIRRFIRVLLWIVLGVVLAGAIAFVVVIAYPAPLERWLQDRVVLALREHYGSEVTLQNLQLTVRPLLHATADNLVVPNRGDASLPPLITVRHLVVQAQLVELLATPVHIRTLQLDGLEIRVGHKRSPEQGGATPAARSANPHARKPRHTHLANFVVDKVEADGAKLYILRQDPAREPLLFDLRKLELRSAGTHRPMRFTAELTNPTPPGLIESSGHFGPWNFDDASTTALGGHYTFQHADLSVFNGISGILSSVGDYSGELDNILVDGTTDTPDFKLDRGGEAVHLTTSFHAIVDGTNGNTYLKPVKAHFRNSDVVTNGGVVGHPGEKGKTITLDADIQQSRVEDVLALAAKSQPAVTGALQVKTKINLPPGKQPVLQRMQLNGTFHVSQAHFTSDTIKRVMLEMSRRGQGRPQDKSITDVAAELAGNFHLKDRTLSFASLQFTVPGAEAQFKGSYNLRAQALNFAGDVRLRASLSEMVGGNKGWLLFPLDPLFSRHGAGTWLPMTIDGTREHPQVHVQWGKLFGGQ